MNTRSTVLLLGIIASLAPTAAHHDPNRAPLPPTMRATANDNRQSAGTLKDGRLELKLDVVDAQWFPEAESGPSLTMQTFAEQGKAPEIPGPMIRVPEGTEIHITIHNSLPDSEVVVHGLHSR